VIRKDYEILKEVELITKKENKKIQANNHPAS
jgi:hypothetical protein